jgi:hypothetical protein
MKTSVCNILNCHVPSCTTKQNSVIISLGSLLDNIRNGSVDKCTWIMRLWIHEGHFGVSENV